MICFLNTFVVFLCIVHVWILIFEPFIPPLPEGGGEKLWTQNTRIIHDVWRLLILSNEKNEWLWNFLKKNDLYENFEKRGVVEKRGEEETYTFYLVYIWHCRIKVFLRNLPNCPSSNFSRYVDLFQEISPRIAKQLRFYITTVPYVDKVKSVKKTGGFPIEVRDMARNMKMELLTFSLYCISRKTVDTEYTYYSWCMIFTIQLDFLPCFPYLFTIQLAFLPYFPYLFTIQLPFFP
jgi:hypothetical protein